jgi:hypothetical protein
MGCSRLLAPAGSSSGSSGFAPPWIWRVKPAGPSGMCPLPWPLAWESPPAAPPGLQGHRRTPQLAARSLPPAALSLFSYQPGRRALGGPDRQTADRPAAPPGRTQLAEGRGFRQRGDGDLPGDGAGEPAGPAVPGPTLGSTPSPAVGDRALPPHLCSGQLGDPVVRLDQPCCFSSFDAVATQQSPERSGGFSIWRA